MLRLPDGMRDRIKAAAEENNRSMNAEIVATLDEKYPAPALDELAQKFAKIFNSFTREERIRLGTMMLSEAGYTEQEIAEAMSHGGEFQVVVSTDDSGDGYGDGFGDGDGAYGDSDGNGDGMGGRS